MSRIQVLGGWVCVLVLLLAASRLGAEACAPSDTALCLNAGRFQVGVHWQDARGRSGEGHAISLTSDTGYFWFFSSSNVELVVKVLNAKAVNGKYWVFFGALSNVQYDLTVKDSATGSVKTYHNPQGQFASVGDTDAFAGSVDAPPANDSVRVAGTSSPPESLDAIQRFIEAPPATADFTPCRETTFGFLLSACRFHIEVSWKDSHGRSGDGHPVQLTNDTGYFWFFADTNVELMIKVLDARAVNGNFWVFFGALSNVEYTVTVTDTVTHAVKTFVNPSGAFASVGDTAAFMGGRSVTPARDDAHAASAELGVTGGSIVAHGADGTTFTLEVPPDALLGPRTITMTPVSRVDRLPISGGLIAGVELEPAGLRLLVPATLTIDPATPTPPNVAVAYAYAGGGENLILYPRLDGDAVSLPVLHFSGYGAGSGAAGDAQQPGSPTGPLDPYVQQYAGQRLLWNLGQITLEELTEQAIEIFSNAYDQVVVPRLNEVKESCDKGSLESAMQIAFDFLRFIQMWGYGADPRMEGFTPQVFDLADEILRNCQQKAYDRCVSRNDPFEITNMMAIARQLQMLGDEDAYLTTFIEDGLMESCLRFEIDFQSKMTEVYAAPSGTTTTRMRYRSQHVPLRFNYAGNDFGRAIWEGSCSLVPEIVEIDLPVPLQEAHCHLTINPGSSTFSVAAAWIGVLDDASSAVRVLYIPGEPTVDAKLICEDSDAVDFPVFQWPLDYYLFHQDEHSSTYGGPLFGAKDWEQLRAGPGPSQNGEFFAMKRYERSRMDLETETTEETFFFLKHTPGAAMPDCSSGP